MSSPRRTTRYSARPLARSSTRAEMRELGGHARRSLRHTANLVPAVGDVGSGLESLVLGMVGVCLECDTSTAAQAGRAEDVGIVVPWVPVAHLRYRWPYRAFPYQQRLTTTTRKHGLMHQRRVSALLRASLATQRDAGCWHRPARASSKGASGAGRGAAWEH